MFVSSANPPGSSASQGLRQRNTAQDARYGTSQTAKTSSKTNGNGSVEMPPVTSAPSQSPIRPHRSPQRVAIPSPGANGSESSIVCITIAVDVTTPRAPPARNAVHGRVPSSASRAPATSPIAAAAGSAGISSTQFARAIEKATENWAIASSAKLIQSSQKRQAVTLRGSASASRSRKARELNPACAGVLSERALMCRRPLDRRRRRTRAPARGRPDA